MMSKFLTVFVVLILNGLISYAQLNSEYFGMKANRLIEDFGEPDLRVGSNVYMYKDSHYIKDTAEVYYQFYEESKIIWCKMIVMNATSQNRNVLSYFCDTNNLKTFKKEETPFYYLSLDFLIGVEYSPEKNRYTCFILSKEVLMVCKNLSYLSSWYSPNIK